MAYIENGADLGLSRVARRAQEISISRVYTDHFLEEYGLLGIDPAVMTTDQRRNVGLAYLNGRLLRTEWQPLRPEEWNNFRAQVARVPKRLQFQLLEKHGCLRKLEPILLKRGNI